jgi:DNA-binding transcriptional regulator YdaS (Cro superfamily)
MNIDDVKALQAIRRRAADEAAQEVAQADAQRADADHALATFRSRVGDETRRAQGLGLSPALALWYRAAAKRLHELEIFAIERADQASIARESLRSAAIEAERIDTVSEQLEAERRAEIARQAQGDMDELALRRRSQDPEV